MAAITEVMDPKVIMDGDIVLLHCPDTSGVVYSKPFGSKEPDFLTIESPQKDGLILELATFCITQRKQSNCQNKIEDSSQLMEIVYGSTIKLQHQVSGKYLTVGNDNKLTLCLEDSDDESGDKNLFKIIPPHQEKGWGESLKISDSIKFESVRGGKIKFQHKPEENCYRPSIETDGTMFFIEFYCQRHATLNPNCIKGGSVVMLASTGIDGYLAAKGSFVSKKLQELKSTHDTDDSKSTCHKVGLRRWRKGFFNIAPFSGDTFFQLENIESKTDKGSQLSFNTGCRIKHLLTQQYISVENQSFKLNVDKNNKYVHFKILPSDVDAKLVASDHIILQHVKTEEYLSFNVTLDDHDNQWSNLVLTKEEIPFKVLQVDNFAIQDAYQIMGISYALCESFDKITDVHVTPDLLKSQLKIVINIMEQLQASFHLLCCKNSSCHIKTNNKTRQANMLRTFQMIDLMITLLEEMTKISADTLKDLAKIDDECFQEACSSICISLQMYVEYGSFKSILYLAQNQPLLKKIENMVGKCSSADKVLITLFNKHREMSHKELIFDLIQNLNLKNSEVFGLMFTLSFNGRWINWKIYEKINERLIPENEEMLSDNVREFLKDFEKERENMESTMTATNVLCSTCVFMKPEEEIGSQVPYNDQSSQRCVQCIQAIQSALPNERACSLLVQLMNVLVFLFDYGAIEISKDVADIIMKLLRDEDTETCNQCVTTVSLKIKKLALLSLKLLLKRNFHAAIEALLNDFNALRKETGDATEMARDSSNTELTSIDVQHPNNNGSPPQGIMKVLLDNSLEVKTEHWRQVIKESQARLRQNFNCNQSYSIFDIATDKGQELSHVLIKLVTHDDADIQLMSTELLYDIYSVEEIVLFEAAERTYFTYSEEEVHKEMKLAAMTDKEQLLYKMLRRETDESAAEEIDKLAAEQTDESAAEEIDELAAEQTDEPAAEEIDEPTAEKIDKPTAEKIEKPTAEKKLQKLLERMTEACIFEDDETKPNSISQHVAYSCGLFNVILEHVLEHKNSSDLEEHEITILTKCFTLLQKLSRKNKRAQDKLFTSFHDFLETKNKDMIKPVICLLNEVFFRNSVLCKRLTDNDIDKIFSTAVISENPEHNELIVTMRIIIESTRPARPMQEYVARLILHHSNSTIKYLLGQEKKSTRKNTLSESEGEDQKPCLLVNVTHLLASCTRECQVAESAASQIYSINELLEIITDDNIKPHKKLPFIRVLTWTYLINEKDSAPTCSKLISTEDFWKFLEKLDNFIDSLIKQIRTEKEQKQLKTVNKSDLTIWIFTKDKEVPSAMDLLYIIEGVIPLLSGLCHGLSCHLYAKTITDMMTPESIEVTRMLGNKLKVFYELQVCSVVEQMEEMTCIKKINSLCEYYETEKFHREIKELTDKRLLYKMLRREIDESTANDLLERMTEACISEDDETKPNSINQNVVYSCGLFNVILEHVLEHKNSSDLEEHEITILTKCFTLLQKLSRKNKRAQDKLFTSFHDFLETKNKDMIKPVICLLNEVFFRNSVLCKRLTDNDIDKIFSTAVISENPEHNELIVTMRIIIESTRPARPMQEYVARLILHHSNSTIKYLLGQEKKSTRKNTLSESEGEDQKPCLLVNVTHLLASCTRECQVAESAASQIYSIDELLEIITDDNIKPHKKLPFIRVLTWTYLINEKDSAPTCSKLISTEDFWKFLEKLDNFIDSLIKQIRTEKEQKQLKTVNKSDLTIWIFTKDKEVPSAMNLLYIIEGVIPLLSGLCHELSCHLYAKTIPDMTPKSIEVTRMLGDKLTVFYELQVCSVVEQMEEMTCIKNINSLCEYYKTEEIKNHLPNDLAMERAEKDRRLNKQFQTFIINYTNAYSDSPGYMKNVPIPKGRSFEKLLEVFVDEDEKLLEVFANEDHIKEKIQSLKVYKLILVLRTLIERQKVLGLHCFERTNLEKMTLTTLQLLYGLVHKRIVIIKSKRDSLKPAEFQKQYKKLVQPIQTIILYEEVDCIQTLFELLHHPNDDITYQVLACLDVLLYGNEEAQRKVTSIIKQDQSLLVCVQKILKEAQNNLKTLKLTTKEPATGQASTSFISEPETTLLHEVKERAISVDDQITMALDVLVWLCDGQQKIMQDALTTQSTFSGSNIVSQVSFLLLDIIEGTAEDLKETDIIKAQKAFQALIEMCAGNYNNQCIAFKGQVIISINAILRKDAILHKKSSDIQVSGFSELKSSSLELLEVMLEKIDKKSSKLAGWILKQLDIPNLLNGMLHSWQSYSRAPSEEQPSRLLRHYNAVKRIFASEMTSPARNSLFRAYHALRRIANYQKISVDELVMYDENMLGKCWSSKEAKESATGFTEENVIEARKMWQHCRKWSRTVEISYKPKHDTKSRSSTLDDTSTEILTQAYFPYNPHTHLGEQYKSTILLHIRRNSPQEKLADLLKWTNKVKSIKERKDNLKRYGIFQFSTIRHYMLYCLTIILNLMILFSLRFPTNNNYNGQACSAAFNDTCNSSSPMYFQPILSPDVPAWYTPLLYIFGLIHLVLALWMVIQYFIRNERKDVRFLPNSVQMFIYKANKGLLRRKYLYQFISKLNDVLCRGKISADKPEPNTYFQIFFFSFQSLYRILFVLFSVAGLATKGYFYCGCILYPFLNNKVMSFIIRALRKSAFQLLTVLTLCFICTYIYAVVSFALLQNYFSEAKDEFCNTLLECFITVSRLGLLNTLGSELSIRPSDEYEPNFQLLLARTVYDIIFFVVVTTLGLNIVIAILVDRFSEMREETDKVDDDNRTRCLVCSITKDELERQGQSFKKHINEDHNVWDYINFVMYLDTIHKNDYNALEKYVSHQVESESIDFFPLKTDSVM